MPDLRKQSYNKFTDFSLFAYNCVNYLLNDPESEIIWKLLHYDTADAWSKTNLTKTQKGGLIYAGQIDQTLFKVFLDTGMDDSWIKQASILRISPIELTDRDYVVGNIRMGFEIYSHFAINHLSNYRTRTDFITEKIISALNGQEIDGIGRLTFNRTSTVGRIPYKGKATTFNNWIG